MGLTVAQLRALVASAATVDEEALATMIAAAEAQVAQIAAPIEEIIEEHRGVSAVIILRNYADHVRQIKERDDEPILEDDGRYRLAPDGRSLTRLDVDGWARRFADPTLVYYTPRSQAALRNIVVAELVKGDIGSNPGVIGMTEGNYSIQFANGSTWHSTSAEALAALAVPWSFS